MNKEQQIEEMQKKMKKCYEKYGSLNFKWFAEALYNAGYRKVPKGSFICSADETNLDVEVCNNCGMQQADELFERDKEIAQLKAENKRLAEKLGQILLNIDTVKEMNAMCNIDEQRKQAVKEFAEKLETQLEEKEQFYICIYDWDRHSAVVDCANEVDELLNEYGIGSKT